MRNAVTRHAYSGARCVYTQYALPILGARVRVYTRVRLMRKRMPRRRVMRRGVLYWMRRAHTV